MARPPSAQRLLQLRYVILTRGIFACSGDPRRRDGRPRGRGLVAVRGCAVVGRTMRRITSWTSA